MYDAIKLGGRVVDLLERGVVALEKLAGVEKKCEHFFISIEGGKQDTHCSKCGSPRERS